MYKYTIQDIFVRYGDEYIKNYKLSKEEWKVFSAIRNCGPKEMGYHICPCEKWIQKESSYLLDTKYFHIITTVPAELNEIFMYNPKIYYNILFKATSESILTLFEDSKWLGSKVGVTSTFHDWVQTLELHPNIHSIVPGGRLKNNHWV